jgi:hypothetical protein
MSFLIVMIIKSVLHRLKNSLISVQRAHYNKHTFQGPLLFDIEFLMDFTDSVVFA